MALVTSYFLIDLLILIATLLIAIFFYFQWAYTYWSRRSIPQAGKPSFPMGHLNGLAFNKHAIEVVRDLYDQNKDEPFSGIYAMHKPALLVRDLDLIKTILVKDFSAFPDHGMDVNVDVDPLIGNLFFLNGKEWRNLRIKLTPTFSSGKMKMMFSTFLDVGKNLVAVLESEAPDVEVKEVLSRYTIDIISSVVFGVECNCLENPNADFRKFAQRLNDKSYSRVISDWVLLFCPGVARILQLRMLDKSMSDYFIKTVEDVMNYRITNNVKRNDFMQLLLQLKTLGHVPDAEDLKGQKENTKSNVFTIEQAAAQAFIFFTAGFETSASTMTFALYELAMNQSLQQEVYNEIRKVKEKAGGSVTYDGLHEMDLLDRTVAETLRKYPVGGHLMRQSNKTFQLSEDGISIEKGTDIWIATPGIHYDEKYYPDPERFDPDRFLPEEKKKRHPYAYLPFGEGPRNCIGARFALMQIRAGLAQVLEHFSVEPTSKTPQPMVLDPSADIATPKGGLHLRLLKR